MRSPPKPNLFIIGAMKCGTSSLHAHLGAHPEIFMSTPKEPSHFVDHETLWRVWPEMARQGYWRTERYLDLFRAAGDAVIVGESSTNYAKLPQIGGVPRRIAEFSPEARFIYLVRDPLRRTISHYWHLVRARREHRDMPTALREDSHYVDVSHYAMQLRAYFDVFGAARVKTIAAEELQSDPLLVLQEVFRWLGVDPTFVPPNLAHHMGATPAAFDRDRSLAMVHRLHASRLWGALAPTLPGALKAVARRLLYRQRTVEIPAAPPAEVVDHLRPILIARTEELERLLDRDFALWTALHGRPGPRPQAGAEAGLSVQGQAWTEP